MSAENNERLLSRRAARGLRRLQFWTLFLVALVVGRIDRASAATEESIEQLIDKRIGGLLDKMVRKGVISADQAAEMKEEDEKPSGGFLANLVAGPEWLESVKLSGDFRGRFEQIHPESGVFPDRNRFRYRLRVGSLVTLKDKFELGLEPASQQHRQRRRRNLGIAREPDQHWLRE